MHHLHPPHTHAHTLVTHKKRLKSHIIQLFQHVWAYGSGSPGDFEGFLLVSWGVTFPFWILFLVHMNSVTYEGLLVFPPLLKIHVTSHIPNLLRPPTSLPFLLSVLKNVFIKCLRFHSFRPLGCLSVKTWDFTKASQGNCFLCLTLFLNLIVTDSTACLVLSLQSQGGNFPVHRSLSITH